MIIQCSGCRTISFCKEYSCTEDVDPETGDLLESISLFPPRIAGRPLLRDRYFLPPTIRKVYEETRLAIVDDMPILAGIGVRAIVETISKDKGAAGRDLKAKISSLVTMHLITPGEGEILQHLRFMGNKAAHESKAHDAEDLSTAFDVVEHLLNTVYLLDRKRKQLTRKSAPPDEEDVL